MKTENNWQWSDWAVVIVLTLVPVCLPIIQYFLTGGHFFYENGYDESYYLIYEKSQRIQSPFRVSQYLVTALHQSGLSGGEINVLFDTLTGFLSIVLTRLVFSEVSFTRNQATFATFCTFTIPFLLGRSFSPYSYLFDWNLASGGFKWINMPEGYFLPFYRSPEPQFSWCLILAGVWVSLRLKNILPTILVSPFLYFSVQVPYAFVAGCLGIYYLFGNQKNHSDKRTRYLIMAGIFMLMSIGIWGMWWLVLKDRSIGMLMGTGHGPLVSVTSLACLIIYYLNRDRFPNEVRFPLLVIACATLAASNVQMIAGVFSQPGQFEHAFGTICFAVLFAFAVIGSAHSRAITTVAIILGVGLTLSYLKISYALNSQSWQWKPLPEQLKASLKAEPEKLLIADPEETRILYMLYPMQGLTPLSYQAGIIWERKDTPQEYLCAKKFVRSDPELKSRMERSIAYLDSLYENRGVNFILLHLNRGRKLHRFEGVDQVPENCPAISYKVYYVE